jgi:hypothetical protein
MRATGGYIGAMTATRDLPPLDRCDPDGVVRAAMAGPAQAGLRDLWLGWVIRLPAEVDVAEAATALLAACGDEDGPDELRRLLEVTADCTPARLSRMPRLRGARQLPAGPPGD